MPLALTVCCSSKSRFGFTFLVPAHPGSLKKWPLNGCSCSSSTGSILCFKYCKNYSHRIWSILLSLQNKSQTACTWMVWQSLAWPRISRSAGSETKKNRGNSRRFFSRYPVSDFWQISSCSSRWGSSWASVSSPVQHSTTLWISCALCIIRCQDLSMFENLFASCRPQHKIRRSNS